MTSKNYLHSKHRNGFRSCPEAGGASPKVFGMQAPGEGQLLNPSSEVETEVETGFDTANFICYHE